MKAAEIVAKFKEFIGTIESALEPEAAPAGNSDDLVKKLKAENAKLRAAIQVESDDRKKDTKRLDEAVSGIEETEVPAGPGDAQPEVKDPNVGDLNNAPSISEAKEANKTEEQKREEEKGSDLPGAVPVTNAAP